MRDIVFRAKSLDNGDWVVGSLLKTKHGAFIQKVKNENTWDSYRVDPSTISQFTGLHDGEAHAIYEGDIVTFDLFNGKPFGVVEWSEYYAKFFIREYGDERKYPDNADLGYMVSKDIYVIGNIHEK